MKRLLFVLPFAAIVAACSSDLTQPETVVTPGTAPTFLLSAAAVNFEPPYTLGTINGQDDWLSRGAAGSGCAVYDHAVASNTYGYTSFGTQSLRISNAVTSGCFSDQTFSKRVLNPAGETGAALGSFLLSGGVLQTHFEAQWDFASTVPLEEQPGLSVVASPDRGDGSRMSWVQMTDTPGGIDINFYDVRGQSHLSAFVGSKVATGLDRTVPHTIKITMDFIDGPSNDVVQVYVDGTLRLTGTSWENYYRFNTQDVPTGYGYVPGVNRVLFRTGGPAAPATAGNGFVIDNFSISTYTPVGPPATKAQCLNNGWTTFTIPRTFTSQGDCVSYVQNGK